MTSKELLFSALKAQKTPRTPWVPFVGCHAGSLIGVTAKDYLQSESHIVDGLDQAIQRYRPDGIPVVFDLQIEAEALGCQLNWADDNPPAVISHPLTEGKRLEDLKIPDKNIGRIPIVLGAAKKIRQKYPDIALYGLVTGPFTLALHLMGTDIFMQMLENPDYVNEVMNFTGEVALKMADYYLEAGCDVIALVDPMTSQIDPFSFQQFVTPQATRIFNYIREKNAFSSFFVCGNAQQNIEAMCDCHPDNISIDENIPLDYVKNIALPKGVSFGGNMRLTLVLLMGTPEDAQREALDCIELGGDTGFILSPGCDLPMHTPPENLEAVVQIVHDEYQRSVIKALKEKPSSIETYNLKDYGAGDKVIVDIITLDSESCAPCQYMVEAVKKVAPYFEGLVEWREHTIKKIEGVSFMSSLMIRNIPTICIDGKIAFVSKIPPQNELITAIQKRINEKFKQKIFSSQAEITLIYSEGDKVDEWKKILERAMNETGKFLKINTTSDPQILQKFLISKTPAIILTKHILKTEGEIPSVEIVKEWLKNI